MIDYDLEKLLPLKDCQTPWVSDKDIQLRGQIQNNFEKHCLQFFKQKEQITNMQYETPGVVHFNFEENIYSQYMEYYKKFHYKKIKK